MRLRNIEKFFKIITSYHKKFIFLQIVINLKILKRNGIQNFRQLCSMWHLH